MSSTPAKVKPLGFNLASQAEPKIAASAVGRIIGYTVLTLAGGWAGLGYYKLQADVRVLHLDSRITTLERKVDQANSQLESLLREIKDSRPINPETRGKKRGSGKHAKSEPTE